MSINCIDWELAKQNGQRHLVLTQDQVLYDHVNDRSHESLEIAFDWWWRRGWRFLTVIPPSPYSFLSFFVFRRRPRRDR